MDTMIFSSFSDMLRIVDVQQALGIGRTKAYCLVQSGELPYVKIGNAIRVPKQLLIDYIQKKSYNSAEADKRRYVEGVENESNG